MEFCTVCLNASEKQTIFSHKTIIMFKNYLRLTTLTTRASHCLRLRFRFLPTPHFPQYTFRTVPITGSSLLTKSACTTAPKRLIFETPDNKNSSFNRHLVIGLRKAGNISRSTRRRKTTTNQMRLAPPPLQKIQTKCGRSVQGGYQSQSTERYHMLLATAGGYIYYLMTF